MVGARTGTHPGLACPPTAPQEDPYLWNKFADGKLHFRNAELLQAVRANQDRRVREFWRVLAICHTVMVQEKNSEPAPGLPPPWPPETLSRPTPGPLSAGLEGAQAPGPSPNLFRRGCPGLSSHREEEVMDIGSQA